MPTTSSGLYSITLKCTRTPVNIYNVFWYRETSGITGAGADLGAIFNSAVVPDIADILSTGVAMDTLTVAEPTSINADFVVATSTSVGTRTGTTMPSFNAASIRLVRSTKETRSGYKRFGPYSEDDVAGTVFEASYLAALNIVAADLEVNLTPSGFVFEPVIVRRLLTPVPWSNVLYNPVSEALVLNRTTSQVSRKYF